MKIDRLIGILSVLLQKEKITAPELAACFEVSRRTINRDIEDLCRAGIPIQTSQGSGGGISIMEGYRTYEIEGDYDPFADYDNDGASNYAEYRAGTNPFDASDKLAITAYSAPQNAPHAISFEYAGGHVYGVATITCCKKVRS